MIHNRPQWQLQALAIRKRENELRRLEEFKKAAKYFEASTNKSKHHEQWSKEEYYDKAIKDAESLASKKLYLKKLEERRKKLEMMLFKENMQYQQELKTLARQPRFFKNGSYLNEVPTSTLKEINQGIMDKEEQLRRQEAELKLHQAWCMSQPELRAASSYIANGRLKSAWLQQIVEKETQKRKEEEEMCRTLKERDEALRKEIQIEEDKQKQKETKMKELSECLKEQISELEEKETAVKILRLQEERDRLLLDQLQLLTKEREKEMANLAASRQATIVNMGLYKYRLKSKVSSVVKEIELDLQMMERINAAFFKDYELDKANCSTYRRIIDTALVELEEFRNRERKRQNNIEAMYDGEARQINEKQDKIWQSERESRAALVQSVFAALKQQIEEKLEESKQMQKQNVLEREKILDQVESFHQEVKQKEHEIQLRDASQSATVALQAQLATLRIKRDALEDRARADARERDERARLATVRAHIAKAQRAGSAHWRNW